MPPLVDSLALGFIALSVVFGLIRGIISQIMALAGIVGAYYFAPSWGPGLGSFAQKEMGCSRFMAEKMSIFVVGVVLYFAARLLGYGIEKLLVHRIKGFW